MRPIAFALALCALPPAALGRNGLCEACGHVASYFRGEGGFIGTVADGAGEVVFVASCGSVSVTGEVPVNGGTAALPFNRANGLACDREGGALEIAGLKDGGWFWITDDVNSAVGSLVRKDVLENETVDIASAGEGVEMAMGTGAVYLRETATGRVGILPNILPEAPMEALRKCGANDRGSTGRSAAAGATASNARYTVRNTECELGDGGAITLATTTNPFSGATTVVADGGAIVRPGGTGSVVVTVDLWGNGSGHFTTAPGGDAAVDGNGDVRKAGARGHALLGNPAVAMTALRNATRLQGVTYAARLGTGPSGAALEAGTAAAGITMTAGTGNLADAVTFSIAADSAYCNANPPRNNSAPVSVTALMTTATDAAQVTPPVALARNPANNNALEIVGGTSFTVVCGSAASVNNMGEELAPENPFPTFGGVEP